MQLAVVGAAIPPEAMKQRATAQELPSGREAIDTKAIKGERKQPRSCSRSLVTTLDPRRRFVVREQGFAHGKGGVRTGNGVFANTKWVFHGRQRRVWHTTNDKLAR